MIKKIKFKKEIVDINPAFQEALKQIEESDRNIFITGKAGTGKSTFLQFWRAQTKKRVAVLAPTGVAALNVEGQTVHSFFGFRPDVTIDSVKRQRVSKEKIKLFQKLDTIVIDEVSMVRADLLDCVDAFLRKYGKTRQEPFGGTHMVFIGDLYQLPPVTKRDEAEIFEEHYATPYFFSAHVFNRVQQRLTTHAEPLFSLVEFEKVYRQRDDAFLDLLNAIRTNTVTSDQLAIMNERVDVVFQPDPTSLWITLTTTNNRAAVINEERLARVKGKLHTYHAIVSGKMKREYFPTDEALGVKCGAQVMMVNNDRQGRWVNGSLGYVREIEYDDDECVEVVQIELTTGDIVAVTPYQWDLFELRYDAGGGGIVSDTVGSFTQYPFRLAWAVTIHKSQGKTFDRVIIDLERGTFASGQLYVALSRCRTFEGIVLRQPITKGHVRMDWRVVKFMTGFQYEASERVMSLDDKIALIKRAITEKRALQITYLKASDVKSRRIVKPSFVGEMDYEGKLFLGMAAYCLKRNDDRVFRVDRILEIALAEE